MRSFLSDFEILNVTTSQMVHRGQNGGTYREHELNRDIPTVVDALQTTIRFEGAVLASVFEQVVDALQTTISEFGAHQSIIEYLPDSGEAFTAM